MAGSLNKALIIGNLTRDPEMRSTPSGQSVCSFGVATNRVWNDRQSGEKKEAVEFHNVVAWGKLAEICAQYLRKGAKVFAEGRLQTRNWEDKQSGKKMYRTEIIMENMVMLDRKSDSTGASPSPSAPPAEASQGADPAPAGDEEEINIEDIPF